MTRILLIQGHPDSGGGHLCHALADAYADGALVGGHQLRRLDLGRLDFPLLRSPAAWETEPAPPVIAAAQESLLWAQHLVLVYPLWLGEMPALVKAFLEQVARPGFAFPPGPRRPGRGRLAGRSCRIIVTMGMPAWFYALWYRAHSLKSLKRNILGFVGIRPIRSSLIGGVGGMEPDRGKRLLQAMCSLGQRAA